MKAIDQKERGAYYTPDEVVRSLVRWAVRRESDRMLDPACGDGRFLVAHGRSFGVEQNSEAAAAARARVRAASVHEEEFFAWADRTRERFDCAAGNPPFIRYQRFARETRRRALDLCSRLGAEFTGLTSSWAPFLVATASLLKEGGRMAFVVPAEIGHAPYAGPLIQYLMDSFSSVRLLAVRKKIFAELSEDVWLLYAENFGGTTNEIMLAKTDVFVGSDSPPSRGTRVSRAAWRKWGQRLRPFLMRSAARTAYRNLIESPEVFRLGDVARVGIGYVTGANDFFHLRPSVAAGARIPKDMLLPSVRSGRVLTARAITAATVRGWAKRDDPMLLLRLERGVEPPRAVRRYLESPAGQNARKAYKCRSRRPWYVVPDVHVPDAFLSYMSAGGPSLVANHARCTCTNSLHAVTLSDGVRMSELQRLWRSPVTALSCEIEGHPLGGGMLKLEPREACRVSLLPAPEASSEAERLVTEALATLRQWRHHG